MSGLGSFLFKNKKWIVGLLSLGLASVGVPIFIADPIAESAVEEVIEQSQTLPVKVEVVKPAPPKELKGEEEKKTPETE